MEKVIFEITLNSKNETSILEIRDMNNEEVLYKFEVSTDNAVLESHCVLSDYQKQKYSN